MNELEEVLAKSHNGQCEHGAYYFKPMEAKQAIQSLINKEKYDNLEQLKKELRDYRDKYPDADWNDLIGYIVGFQNRPQQLSKGGK